MKMKRFLSVSMFGAMAMTILATAPQSIQLSDNTGKTSIASMGPRRDGVKAPKLAPRHEEGKDIVTIVDEDFSLMTGGSQEPDALYADTDYLGMPGEPTSTTV